MRLFEELQRRNVFRVGVAYLVAAWLLLQVADILVPILNLPASTSRFIFLMLAAGFVPALFFAWVYELTSDGLVRESEIDRSQSATRISGRKLDFAIIVICCHKQITDVEAILRRGTVYSQLIVPRTDRQVGVQEIAALSRREQRM